MDVSRKCAKWIIWALVAGLLVIAEGRSAISAGYRNVGNVALLWVVEGDKAQPTTLETAETYLGQTVFLDPDQPGAHRSLGETRVMKDDYTGAQVAFLKSRVDSHLNALQMVWLFFTGEQRLRQQRYDEAWQIHNVMATLTADNTVAVEPSCETKAVETALGRAWRLGHEGDLQAEEIAYHLVIALAPGCPDAYYRLGGLYYAQQRYDEAVRAYQQGISVDSKTIICGYEYLAGAYMEQGQLEKGRHAAETASQYGGGPQASMLLGRVYQLKGDFLLAGNYYLTATRQTSQCIQDDWSQWMAYFYLGWMAFDRYEYDLALFYMREASQVMAGTAAEPQALKYVGDMYRQRGMLQEAIQEYEKAVKLAPSGWEWVWRIHWALADTYRDGGRYDDAIREYKVVLSLSPQNEAVKLEFTKLKSER
jgi:tetratricopeptide (TPR) repeat protein